MILREQSVPILNEQKSITLRLPVKIITVMKTDYPSMPVTKNFFLAILSDKRGTQSSVQHHPRKKAVLID